MFSSNPALADDVGITKARLIQKSEKSYVLEADVTQALVWAIKAPIFPDRFQVSALKYINQAGWIVVQAEATTSGEPLSAKDEILLPWMRNGVAITAQWRDGTIQQNLFLRSLEGIHVPMRLLIPSTQTLAEVCREHFVIGLEHLTFKWIHLLLVGVLVFWVTSYRQVLTALMFYAFGQAVALILADFGLPGFDLLFADILGMILLFLLAIAAARQASIRPYIPLFFIYGVLHSLAYAQALTSLDLSLDHRPPALFMFNIAIDSGHLGFATFLWLLGSVFMKWPHARKTVVYGAGICSVALLAVVFQEHVVTGSTRIIYADSGKMATQFSLPVSQKSPAGGQRPKGARRMTNPVMNYLTVEPYEVRQETLIQARAAVQFLGVNDEGKGSIPIESLEPVKKGILDTVRKANPILIDGQQIKPILARADFVTLGPAGVMIRPEPVVESLDNGIIGLTLVYETPEMADEIKMDWRLFTNKVQKIEATTTDPFGGATMILSPDENVLQWKSRLAGYRVPVIEKVITEKQRLPVVSVLLFFSVIVWFIFSVRRKTIPIRRTVLVTFIGLGFLLYPFYRIPLDLPFVKQWTPSVERTSTILEGLLTNVYRAFDVRDENRVYDRLAVSVMGDQLTQIYLQNRRSLELENRGGARANTDEVTILSVGNVKRAEGDGFVADAVWTVSGSVSHFGHTHYRRNKNHALVTFVVDDDAWKIKDIDVIEEKRVL